MKKTIFPALLMATCLWSCNEAEKKEAAAAPAADSTAAKTETPATKAPLDSATMVKNWEAYMTPGDMQKMMGSWAGDWTCEVTSWMVPGAPPTKSTATAKYETSMGGRYLVSHFNGNMMGQPFEGLSTQAYDNAKKKFISTWIDNFGTGIMVTEGPWDAATKSITFTGKMVDPSAGDGSEVAVREIYKVIDDKHHQMEMYAPGSDGKEYKNMEITYTKK